MKYQKIRRYKYRLYENIRILLPIDTNCRFSTKWFSVCNKEVLVLAGYCWDGASGPAIDTKDFMVGSLIHDVLYQSMRIELMPKSFRKQADKILRLFCLKAGMNPFRAWYVYKAVRIYGGKAMMSGKAYDAVYTV